MNTGPSRVDGDQDHVIDEAMERLRREFAGTFDAETIERAVTGTRRELESRARFSTWLPVLIERAARDRLRAAARAEAPSLSRPAVLFLCVHNAGRSQMAAGWLRHLGGDRVDVYSGGSDPGQDVNPAAVAAMAEVGIDIAGEQPKPWTDDIVRAADVIVSMGCGDACPIHAGKRYEDWELADPAGQSLDAVREVRDEIRDLVAALVVELGIAGPADGPA